MDQLERERPGDAAVRGARPGGRREEDATPLARLHEPHDPRDALAVVVLDVQGEGLSAAGRHDVVGVARRLEAGADQLTDDVHAGGVGTEAVVGDDEDVARRREAELVERLQHAGDLAADRRAGGGRADAEAVLGVIGLRQPVDHDRRPELRQHVLAQHALRPRHRGVIGIGGAAFPGRRTELAQDRRAHVGRVGDRRAGIEAAVDEHADARRRSRVQQQRAAGRAGADGGQPETMRVEPLAEGGDGQQPTAGRLLESQERAMVVGAERLHRIERGDVHLVAGDPVRRRLGAGRQRGGVHPGDRREDCVAVREVHALGAQAEEGGRVLGGDRVRPQPVDDEDDDETRGQDGRVNDAQRSRIGSTSPAFAGGRLNTSRATPASR